MTRVGGKAGSRSRWRGRRSVALAFGALLLLAPAVLARAADAPKAEDAQNRVGYAIRVTLPIDGQTTDHVRQFVRRAVDKAQAANERPVLILTFDVPAGQEQFGAGSEFGAAYSLADFLSSDALNAATTVAYLPKSIRGHAVLPVIACDQIIMAPDATIGPANTDDQTLTAPVRSAYREIAGRRRTVPAAIAMGMLDPAVEVLEVKTEAGTEYVTPEGFEELKKHRATEKPIVLKEAGKPGLFTAAEGRRIGFVSYLAANRRDIVKALNLPPTALEDDPSLADGWRAMRVEINGPITARSVEQLKNLIDDRVRQQNVNFVCVWIDSPGGTPADALSLADFLAFRLDPSKVRTVAYIPNEARSTAAIVALACDQVVMHSNAILGGPGAFEPSADEIAQMRQVIRKELAPRKGRSWSLMAALVDPRLEVFEVSKPGDVQYFCEVDLAVQPDAAKWKKGRIITTPGMPLRLSGDDAKRYGLVNRVVADFGGLKRFYGLQNDPALAEPDWASILIQAMASWEVSLLLLVIGGAALYVELHSPGIGVGGFVAMVCFLLFFWGQFLGGTANWLEIILFLAGVACLLLEIFVIPGFGIFGLGGGALILASIVLASQTFIWPHNEYQMRQFTRSLGTVAGALVTLMALAVLLRRWLPQTPLLSAVFLAPPEGEEAETIRRREALADFRELLGQRGVTTTRLYPAGKARFGDQLVDVMADGEAIDRGATIEVVDVRGSRVLVQEATEDA